MVFGPHAKRACLVQKARSGQSSRPDQGITEPVSRIDVPIVSAYSPRRKRCGKSERGENEC
jgi:hypothetical protein